MILQIDFKTSRCRFLRMGLKNNPNNGMAFKRKLLYILWVMSWYVVMGARVHYRSSRSSVSDRFIALRASGRECHFVFCSFNTVSLKIEADEFIYHFKEILDRDNPEIFFLGSGDVGIIWDASLAASFYDDMIKFLHQLYPVLLNSKESYVKILPLSLTSDEIMAWFEHLPENIEGASDTSQLSIFPRPLTFAQEASWGRSMLARKTRKTPEALIVEDQTFTSLMLTSMLKQDFNCTVTADAPSAFDLYIQLAPDITFLDVELASGNGHGLAQQFRGMDRYGYLLMATANHRLEDVEKAKANQVNGFIVKPFTRDKLVQHLKKFRDHKELWNGIK